MSFKIGRYLYFTISSIVGIFFILLGICTLAIPSSASLRKGLVDVITNQTHIFILFGLAFFVVGLSIVIYSFAWIKKRYDHIQIKKGSVLVDEALVQQYLQAYWKEHFKVPISSTVTIKKNSIQIIADFPSLPILEQKSFLERLQKDFVVLFDKTLGTSYDVELLASFGNEKK